MFMDCNMRVPTLDVPPITVSHCGIDTISMWLLYTYLLLLEQELFQVRNHRDYLSSIAISESLGSAASCGDSSIRIHDIQVLNEITAIIDLEDEPKGLLSRVEWIVGDAVTQFYPRGKFQILKLIGIFIKQQLVILFNQPFNY